MGRIRCERAAAWGRGAAAQGRRCRFTFAPQSAPTRPATLPHRAPDNSPGTAGPRPRRGPGRTGGPWCTARRARSPGVPPVLFLKQQLGVRGAECAPTSLGREGGSARLGRPGLSSLDQDSLLSGSSQAQSRPRRLGSPLAAEAAGDARGTGLAQRDCSWNGNFRFSPLSFNPRVGKGRLLPGFVLGVFAGKKREGGGEKTSRQSA